MKLCYANNPKSLFRKYAGLTTAFANTGIGRDFLSHHSMRVPKKVALMLPNGFIEKDRGVNKATFYPRAPFASKFYPALAKIDLVSRWIKDFKEAKHLLAWELGLTRRIPALAKAVMFASPLTAYPVAGANEPVDGRVGRGGVDETFAAIRSNAGNGASVTEAGSSFPYVGASATQDQWVGMHRSIFCFDTSSIGAGQDIISALLHLWGNNKGTNLGETGLGVEITAVSPANFDDLEIADYGQFGGTSFATMVYATWTLAQYNVFTLDGNGRDQIDPNSITAYGEMNSWDFNGNFTGVWANGGAAYMGVTFADAVGTDNDPKLVVTYTILAAAEEGIHAKKANPIQFYGGFKPRRY